MSVPDSYGDYVRRIVLPSGKTIEIVYFADREEGRVAERRGLPTPVTEPAAPEALRALEREDPAEELGAPREMHVCPSCHSELVYPTHWQEQGPEHWSVCVRCPNCEWTWSGVAGQEILDRFDEELDRGTDALVRDLKELVRANMAEEIDRFVAALEADAIVPMDF